MTLEQVFEQIAQSHDVHLVEFNINKRCSPEHRFSVSMQWTGHSRGGNPCESAMGPDFASALRECLAKVRESRGLEPNVDFSEILKIAA